MALDRIGKCGLMVLAVACLKGVQLAIPVRLMTTNGGGDHSGNRGAQRGRRKDATRAMNDKKEKEEPSKK